MKKGWQTKKLSDVCSIASALVDPRMTKYEDMLHVGGANIESATGELLDLKTAKEEGLKSGKFAFDDSMVLYSKIRPYLMKVARPDFQGLCSADIYPLTPDPAVLDRSYLFHQLLSPQFTEFAVSGSARAGMPKVNRDHLFTYQFPVPPLAEQQRIVGLLDEAFEGLATARANAEKNLQNARALFESHLQSVFTQRGKGWKMEKLDDLTELARGHNPPKSKFSLEQKPGYVRFYQIRDGGTDDYTVYVPDTPQLHKMKKDDIMMVAYRHVGRAFRGVEGAFNVALCKISNARRDLLDDDYLFHMIPSPFVKGELLKRSERSLIPSMSIEHLRELRIPLPPLPEQQKIVKLINSLSTETQRFARLYERRLAALEALKKSLLHQAFSGEL
jgi:restriction endonuclease S subunit